MAAPRAAGGCLSCPSNARTRCQLQALPPQIYQGNSNWQQRRASRMLLEAAESCCGHARSQAAPDAWQLPQ